MAATKVGGAWKKQTSKGEVISFTIGDKRYSMWVNTYKKEEKQPDFTIYEDDYKPNPQQQQQQPAQQQQSNTVADDSESQLPF